MRKEKDRNVNDDVIDVNNNNNEEYLTMSNDEECCYCVNSMV